MKAYKVVVLLTMMLASPLLAGCGVDTTDTERTPATQGMAAAVEEGSSVEVTEMAIAAPACTGSITCCSSTSCVSVLCKGTSATTCKATCPSSTRYMNGACAWAEPAPVPEPL